HSAPPQGDATAERKNGAADPVRTGPDELGGRVLTPALEHLRLHAGLGYFATPGRPQQRSEQYDDNALPQTEPEERVLEALGHRLHKDGDAEQRKIQQRLAGNHVLDGCHGQRRTRAKSGGCQTCRQTALVGEPLERIADARAIDATRADPSDDLGGIETSGAAEGRGVGVHHPAEAGQDAADQNDQLWTPLVDEPALDGNEPCLEQDEQGKGDLDLRPLPVKCLLNIWNKERPTVLQVGDHHHADETDDELCPAKEIARPSRVRLQQRVHGASHPRGPNGACGLDLSLAGMLYASVHTIILKRRTLNRPAPVPLPTSELTAGGRSSSLQTDLLRARSLRCR